MLYVITEDTNSGRDFWNKVFNIFLGKDNYEMVQFIQDKNGKPISGNMALNRLVDKALLKAKAGDSIFIAFDNIGSSKRVNTKTAKDYGFDSGDFINITLQKCSISKVNLYISSYYCFEEIYLSYEGLYELCKIDGKDQQLTSVVKFVKDSILNGTEYYDRNNKNIQYVISKRQDAAHNKEHFADALLFQSTYGIKNGYFVISKSTNKNCILKCWTETCSVLRNKNLKNIQHFCSNCKFCMRDKSDIEKLIDLNNRSLIDNTDIDFTELVDRFVTRLT